MKRLHFHLTTDQTDLLLARGKSLFARLSDGTVQLWNSCWYFPLLLLVMLAALAAGDDVIYIGPAGARRDCARSARELVSGVLPGFDRRDYAVRHDLPALDI